MLATTTHLQLPCDTAQHAYGDVETPRSGNFIQWRNRRVLTHSEIVLFH